MTKEAEFDPTKEKRKVTARDTVDLEHALAHLEDILGGVRHGGLRLRSGDAFMDLVPGRTVDIEVSAKQKDGTQRLSFELSWKFDPSTVRSEAEPVTAAAEGESCVTQQVRSIREAIEEEEACAARKFELELFGGCECAEVPSC